MNFADWLSDWISAGLVRWEIDQTIRAAWANATPEEKMEQNKRFPNGRPEPEEFIRVIAAELKEKEKEKEQNNT